jgi:hypothetical protein
MRYIIIKFSVLLCLFSNSVEARNCTASELQNIKTAATTLTSYSNGRRTDPAAGLGIEVLRKVYNKNSQGDFVSFLAKTSTITSDSGLYNSNSSISRDEKNFYFYFKDKEDSENDKCVLVNHPEFRKSLQCINAVGAVEMINTARSITPDRFASEFFLNEIFDVTNLFELIEKHGREEVARALAELLKNRQFRQKAKEALMALATDRFSSQIADLIEDYHEDQMNELLQEVFNFASFGLDFIEDQLELANDQLILKSRTPGTLSNALIGFVDLSASKLTCSIYGLPVHEDPCEDKNGIEKFLCNKFSVKPPACSGGMGYKENGVFACVAGANNLYLSNQDLESKSVKFLSNKFDNTKCYYEVVSTYDYWENNFFGRAKTLKDSCGLKYLKSYKDLVSFVVDLARTTSIRYPSKSPKTGWIDDLKTKLNENN